MTEANRLAAWLTEGAWHQMTLGDVIAAGRELRRLQAENEALRAGAERLDHLQRGVTVELIYEGLAPRFRVGGHNSGTNSNLRAAIDASRAKEQT